MTALLTDTLLPTVASAEPVQRRDRGGTSVAAFAILVSLASVIYFRNQGALLSAKDSIAHLEIARRVIDSPTSGFGQLGGVWLPLPHILMLPFVWNNALYYSGLAGSIPSMLAYVATCVIIYKTVYHLTGGRYLPAVLGTLVFAVNPNVLYLQSTPMTEMLLFAALAAVTYCTQRWIQTDRYEYLLVGGLASVLGTLTRYEAWVFLAAETVVVLTIMIRRHYPRHKVEGVLLAFLMLAGVGIVSWLSWNYLIFHDPLNFQRGSYAKPSLWVGNNDRTVGSARTSLLTYWDAVVDNLGLPVAVATVLGSGVLLLRRRASLAILPSIALLAMFPFFVVALFLGQRPLHVTQINGDFYNVRFGLVMIVPAAILLGCLLSMILTRTAYIAGVSGVAAVAVTTCVASLLTPGGVITRSGIDVLSASDKRPTTVGQLNDYNLMAATSQFLRQHYTTGRVLMESFGNELVLFDARIDSGRQISESSYRLWQPALKAPLTYRIDWIVMRRKKGQSDLVYASLQGSDRLSSYLSVYENPDYIVYEKK
jgi:hypothetical protein